jgi:protein-tyrosine phosphatase
MSDVSVLFVCLGNICRSPTAHGIFQHLVTQEKLAERILIDSAGTGDWHIGHAPDRRSQAAAIERGYDISHLRARQVSAVDFSSFDYILATDNQNLVNLKAMKPANFGGHLGLFLAFGGRSDYREVPDPYYGGEDGFQLVLDLIQDASEGLLDHIRHRHLGG